MEANLCGGQISLGGGIIRKDEDKYICPRCKRRLDITDFYVRPTFPTGYSCYCKDCTKQETKERYLEKHKESVVQTKEKLEEKQKLFEAGLKECSKCGKVLPVDEFYVSTRTVDGRYGWCKSCCAASKRERYNKNNADKVAKTKEKEELLLLGKKRCAICGKIFDISETTGNFYVSYCNDCNRNAMERDRERSKKYWEERPERRLENGRKYRENNLEHCRKVARENVKEKRRTDVVF